MPRRRARADAGRTTPRAAAKDAGAPSSSPASRRAWPSSVRGRRHLVGHVERLPALTASRSVARRRRSVALGELQPSSGRVRRARAASGCRSRPRSRRARRAPRGARRGRRPRRRSGRGPGAAGPGPGAFGLLGHEPAMIRTAASTRPCASRSSASPAHGRPPTAPRRGRTPPRPARGRRAGGGCRRPRRTPRPRWARGCRRSSVARPARLRSASPRAPRRFEHDGAMDPADAGEDGERMVLGPPRRRLGPLGGAAEVADAPRRR